MNQAEWFYELLSEERGPVTIDQIRQLMIDGTLQSTDRIRHSASDEWITVTDLPSPVAEDASVADELTDLSELSFSFESSEDAVESSDDVDDLDINSFNISSEADEPVESPLNDLSIDGFRIEGDTQTPRTRPVIAEAPEEETEELYFVESLGQVLGPMPLAEMVTMAQSGALSETDRIRSSRSSDWASPLTVPAVAMGILTVARTAQAQSSTQIGSVTAKRLQAGEGAGLPADQASPANAKPSSRTRTPEKKAVKKKSANRKEAKKDELLAEIFSEVFDEDGKVKEDRDPSRHQQTAPMAAPMSAAASPVNPAAPSPQQPPGMLASPPQPAYQQPAYQPPTPPRTMPRPPAKKSSSGGFQMPEPKVLGMVGGGLAVLLLIVVMFSGGISIPGLGPDVDGFLNSVATEYKTLGPGPVAPDKWADLRARVSSEGRAIITHYSKSGSLSADDNKKRWAVAKLVELVNCDPADIEKRKSVFEGFEKLRGG